MNLTFNWNNGNIGSTAGFGTTFGSATITESGTGNNEFLIYSITLNDSTTTPNTWFHSPNGGTPTTLGFSLDVSTALISAISFNGGASGTSTGGGMMDGTGTWGYSVGCTSPGCQASLTQVSTLTFDVKSANIGNPGGGLSLADVIMNNNNFFLGADVWTNQGASGAALTGFIAATPTSSVPEPATWGMMLLGFLGLSLAFRQTRRRVSFA
jgi:hypothetical protein